MVSVSEFRGKVLFIIDSCLLRLRFTVVRFLLYEAFLVLILSRSLIALKSIDNDFRSSFFTLALDNTGLVGAESSDCLTIRNWWARSCRTLALASAKNLSLTSFAWVLFFSEAVGDGVFVLSSSVFQKDDYLFSNKPSFFLSPIAKSLSESFLWGPFDTIIVFIDFRICFLAYESSAYSPMKVFSLRIPS